MNAKLKPRFLVLLKSPVVLILTNLYKTAAEKAINIDLILISPKAKRFSSLNLVISFDNLTSMSFHYETLSYHIFLQDYYIFNL